VARGLSITPAYKIVLLKPSIMFKSIASDLCNTIGVEMYCQNYISRQYFMGDSGYSDEFGNDENTNGQF
jgi:hypothetical protein